jgi:signal transduction histidine kinase
MRKHIVFLFIASLIITQSFAQNLKLIQNLKKELKKSSGKKKFSLLADVAWEYRWAYPDSTIYYADSSYRFGQAIKIDKDLARPLNYKGVAFNYKGNILTAFDIYSEALKVSQQQRDSIEIAYSNNNIGRLFFEQGILSRSYSYFVTALSIFKAVKDSSGLAYTYQSLANLYRTQKDFEKAEINYVNAYKIRLSLGNTRNIMSALVQLGRLYQETGQHDKAIKFFTQADSAGQVINDAINLAEVKTFAAESYLSKGLLQKAESMCAEGLKHILSKNNIFMLSHVYVTMGHIEVEKKDAVKARKYFDLALSVSTQTKDINSKMEAHYFLWKLSEKENKNADMIKNQNAYLILKDSIKDLNLARQVERLQFEIDIQQREQENEVLKLNSARNGAIIRQQKLQNFSLIALVGLISVVGFIQWLNSKKRREINQKLTQKNVEIQKQREEIVRQNDKLSKRNQQLSEINYEKDTLMSIVAHDLKSPLNRIKGLTELMELEGGMKDTQLAYLRMSKDATRAGLDLITDLLDVHMLEENTLPNYSSFDISVFLLEKIKEFAPAAEAKGIHLRITQVMNDEVILDIDYLGRIVDNLLSNAIKFSNRDTVVDVAAWKVASHIWISIKDQGPGFSDRDKVLLFQKFKKLSARPTAGETSNGLGLAIVKTLIDRMKGEIQLNSDTNKGSEFIIKLPALPM